MTNFFPLDSLYLHRVFIHPGADGNPCVNRCRDCQFCNLHCPALAQAIAFAIGMTVVVHILKGTCNLSCPAPTGPGTQKCLTEEPTQNEPETKQWWNLECVICANCLCSDVRCVVLSIKIFMLWNVSQCVCCQSSELSNKWPDAWNDHIPYEAWWTINRFVTGPEEYMNTVEM